MPRSSPCGLASISVTGMPMLASAMAMPPPMVPAPITATLRIGRSGVSEGMSGIFAASAAADLAWTAARSRSASLTVNRSVVLMVSSLVVLQFSGLAVDELAQALLGLRRTCARRVELLHEQAVVVRHVLDAGQHVDDHPVGLDAVLRDASGQLTGLGQGFAGRHHIAHDVLLEPLGRSQQP